MDNLLFLDNPGVCTCVCVSATIVACVHACLSALTLNIKKRNIADKRHSIKNRKKAQHLLTHMVTHIENRHLHCAKTFFVKTFLPRLFLFWPRCIRFTIWVMRIVTHFVTHIETRQYGAKIFFAKILFGFGQDA